MECLSLLISVKAFHCWCLQSRSCQQQPISACCLCVHTGGALLARTPPSGAKSRPRVPTSQTNRQLDMEDPLSPQPNPTPTPVRPLPGLNTLLRSHMRTADRQLASQNKRQSSEDVNLRQAGLEQIAEGLGLVQTSPLGQGGSNAVTSVGGVKLARTPIGKSAGKKTHLLQQLYQPLVQGHNNVNAVTTEQFDSGLTKRACTGGVSTLLDYA